MADIVLPAAGDEISATWGQSVAKGINGIQAGSQNVTLTSQNTNTATVVFPKAYASAPNVVASAVVGSGTLFAIVDSVSATQVVLRLVRKDEANTTATVRVDWVAIGVLA